MIIFLNGSTRFESPIEKGRKGQYLIPRKTRPSGEIHSSTSDSLDKEIRGPVVSLLIPQMSLPHT